jgi:hypothetical protein
VSAALHTVHVRVNDAATGQPTPCRIRFTDTGGRYYAPFGRQTNFAQGWNEDVGGNLYVQGWQADGEGNICPYARRYAFIDGTCEIGLPAGSIRVEVHKGPEYQPLCEEVILSPNRLALRLSIASWTDMRAEGWYSGDARCHWLTPHAALLEGAAEDLAVVNLLAKEVTLLGMTHDPGKTSKRRRPLPAVPNLLAFSGQKPALEVPGHLVVVNTQNYHGMVGDVSGDFGVLGELSLLNCHRIVYPLRFGGMRRGIDNWTLADWCDQCHRKGGLVVWSNITWRSEVLDSYCGEALADLILGKVDAIEVHPGTLEQNFDDWYKLLNCGIRVPLVGASAKEWNNHPLGFVRTYARLPERESFSYSKWIEAVRAGRTFITIGPLLRFTVNGQEAGSVIQLSSPGTVHVYAEARSLEPFDSLGLIVNGTCVKSVSARGAPSTAILDRKVKLQKNSWLAACCYCYDEQHMLSSLMHSAHTSPVYVEIAGKPWHAGRKTVSMLLPFLEAMLDWVAHEARCETDQQRERLANIFRSARQVLLDRQSV